MDKILDQKTEICWIEMHVWFTVLQYVFEIEKGNGLLPQVIRESYQLFNMFCKRLHQYYPRLHLWAPTVFARQPEGRRCVAWCEPPSGLMDAKPHAMQVLHFRVRPRHQRCRVSKPAGAAGASRDAARGLQ